MAKSLLSHLLAVNMSSDVHSLRLPTLLLLFLFQKKSNSKCHGWTKVGLKKENANSLLLEVSSASELPAPQPHIQV